MIRIKNDSTIFMSWLIIFVCLVSSVDASEKQKGGYLMGKQYVYTVGAADGWVADSKSGAPQGLQLVFYPVGSTWANSDAIIYGRSVPNSRSGTIERHVINTVKKYVSEGSPNYRNSGRTQIVWADGRTANVYFYEGDQWGNYEAAIYFQEKNTLNYLVFAATKKEAFDQYLPDFYKIAATYLSKYSIESVVDREKFESLQAVAKEARDSIEGENYHKQVLKSQAEYMGGALRACTSITDRDGDLAFHYFVEIGKNGAVINAYVYPYSDLGLCFNGLLSNAVFPHHQLGNFLWYMPIEISN